MPPPNLLKEIRNKGLEHSLAEADRLAYSRDCSSASMIRLRGGEVEILPKIIVWPKNNQEVSTLLALANTHQMPVVPYGAGSGVCGGAIPIHKGIVLDLKKMDQILFLDEKNLRVRAQCGILGEILERELNRKGYTLGHFPSSIYTATLGGYLACRSAGQLSTKYGKIEDLFHSMKVVLATGGVVDCSRDKEAWFSELILGSEGTLGVVTEAELHVRPLPEKRKYVGFQFESVAQGLEAIRLFMQKGFRPAVVRLYDPLDSFIFSTHPSREKNNSSFSFIPEKIFSFLGFAKWNSLQMLLLQPSLLNKAIDFALKKSLLILGFEGAAWKLDHELLGVQQICKREGGKSLGEAPGLQWLKRRYSVSYKMSPLVNQGFFVDTMEVASSWTNLAKLYEGVKSAIGQEALVMAHFSHAYHDGCSIYFTFLGHALGKEKTLKQHRRVWDKGMEASLKAGGTISHHHGIGTLKAEAFVQELGPLYAWWKNAKAVLDPQAILNPGKMGL
ncbi:MAG: FAD-binding oxidoreductase [Deltaproteobacteria bacterium]|nr:FAD-binding oxidoreductase [Deltaproteobacteria bacterium]